MVSCCMFRRVAIVCLSVWVCQECRIDEVLLAFGEKHLRPYENSIVADKGTAWGKDPASCHLCFFA